jgi:signal transduction histidine kinase
MNYPEEQDFFIFKEWNWQKSLFLLIAIGLLVGLAVNLSYLKKTSRDLINEPGVINLKDYIISSKYYFPKSTELENKNWVTNDYDDSNWPNTELGKYELIELDGYKEATGSIFHRIKIKIPAPLINSKEPIAILFRTISFLNYEVYMSGNQITESPGINIPSDVGLFAIPKIYIGKDQNLIIAIKGTFTELENGLAYFMPTLIGPKAKLDASVLRAERVGNTYPNVVAATKGGIVIFFILLFLAAKFQRFIYYFLIFAVCNSVDSIFTLSASELIFNIHTRAFIVFNLQAIGFAFLWRLFESLFGVKYKIQYLISMTHLLVVNILLVFYSNLLFKVELDLIFNAHALFLSEILFAICLTAFIETYQQPFRRIANLPIQVFNIVFVIYFLSYVYLRYFLVNRNKNGHQYLDILFFIFIAFIVASEFAKNQYNLFKQKQILDAQKNDVSIGQSAARIAHDIRKPFSNLKIALATINQACYEPEVVKRLLKEISNSVKYGEDLANQILDSKNSDILQFKPIEPKALIEQFKTIYCQDLNKKDIEIIIDDRFQNKILGSESKLLAVIQNLFQNAEDAMKDNSIKKIKLTFRPHKDSAGKVWCKLLVENNGPPIPKQILVKLFRQSITYGKAHGTGLGLVGVKNLLDEMGGSISAYNLLNQNGVVFELLLLAEANQDSPNTKNSESLTKPILSAPIAVGRSKRSPEKIDHIAVVDDDELIHMTWKLAWKGPNLDLYETPEDLLASLNSNPELIRKYDLIITDRFFGEKSQKTGIDLSHALNGIGYSKVILCSGSEDVDPVDAEHFLKVIPKQVFTIEQLRQYFVGAIS